MPRIALVPSAFHPSLGGVEELTRQLAAQLDDVFVVTNRWPRDLPRHEVLGGVDVYRLAFRTPVGGIKARLSYPLSRPLVLREMVRLLHTQRAEVVHVQCVSGTAHYAIAAAKVLGLPVVVSLQGELTMDASQIFQRSPFMAAVMRSSLLDADAVTACTAATLAEAETFLGRALRSPGRVVHNGVSVAEISSAEPAVRSRPFVLALGRHVPQKGFDVLLEAWALLGRSDVDLVLAGEGPETENLRKLRDSLGLTSIVDMIGRTGRAETAGLFRGCEFFVLPSRHEPQGIVTLEAMAAGKAVVATDVGGVAEIVGKGRTGLLVPGDSAPALAAALEQLMADGALRSRLGAAGQAIAAAHDWANIRDQYSSVYTAVLQAPLELRTQAG